MSTPENEVNNKFKYAELKNWNNYARKYARKDQNIPNDLVEIYASLSEYLKNQENWEKGLKLLEITLRQELNRRIKLRNNGAGAGGLNQTITANNDRLNKSPLQFEQQIEKTIGSLKARADKAKKEEDYLAYIGYRIDHIQHLLSAVLSRVEQHNGFTIVEQETQEHKLAIVPLVTGFIQPPDFLKLVKAGVHWKDPGVPGDHGEYTHRIQWFILLTSELRFDKSMLEIYKGIGSWYIQNDEIKDKNNEVRFLSVWDMLFDRSQAGQKQLQSYYVTHEETDFRSPENLNRYLIDPKNQDKYPLLSALLTGRHYKRKCQYDDLNRGEKYGADSYPTSKTEGKEYGHNRIPKYVVAEMPNQFSIGNAESINKILLPIPPKR